MNHYTSMLKIIMIVDFIVRKCDILQGKGAIFVMLCDRGEQTLKCLSDCQKIVNQKQHDVLHGQPNMSYSSQKVANNLPQLQTLCHVCKLDIMVMEIIKALLFIEASKETYLNTDYSMGSDIGQQTNFILFAFVLLKSQTQQTLACGAKIRGLQPAVAKMDYRIQIYCTIYNPIQKLGNSKHSQMARFNAQLIFAYTESTTMWYFLHRR